jgi:glucose/mannose-6-phosphate isomerase
MAEATFGLARQLEQAIGDLEEIWSVTGRACRTRPNVVGVVGMGGSAVAGTVLQAIAAPSSKVPVVLVDTYEPPVCLGAGGVVFAVSYSGETEETIAAAMSCLDRGAHVIALTRGGTLAATVEARGGGVIRLVDDLPQPRAAVGAMTARLVLAGEALGLLEDGVGQMRAAMLQLDRRLGAESSLGKAGVAVGIAERIGRTIPVVYGAVGLGAAAAYRWKTQVNENAKAPAFAGSQPEVCHNEVCGFGQHGDVTRQLLSLVGLRLGSESPQLSRRFRIFEEVVDEAVGDVIVVDGEGEGDLARFFDLVAIGDLVSLHLAAREGVDPGPVPVLEEIKNRLGSGR